MPDCDGPGIVNPAELIERLRQHPDVVGILRYGSGMWPESADFDLCVVVAERPAGLESVHFWVGDGPVDLNIRTLEELKTCTVAPGFDEVFARGKVLYEKSPGALAGLAAGVKSTFSPPDAKTVAFMRHGHAHYLLKLDHYRDRDPLLCKVLLSGAVHWLLHAYVMLRGVPYRGEKAALGEMAAEPALLRDIGAAAGGGPLDERIEALRRATAVVLTPVGGAWRQGEVLFFTEPGCAGPADDAWCDFFQSLMRQR